MNIALLVIMSLLPRFFYSLDTMVSTIIYEAFGLLLVEGLVYGCPCVFLINYRARGIGGGFVTFGEGRGCCKYRFQSHPLESYDCHSFLYREEAEQYLDDKVTER